MGSLLEIAAVGYEALGNRSMAIDCVTRAVRGGKPLQQLAADPWLRDVLADPNFKPTPPVQIQTEGVERPVKRPKIDFKISSPALTNMISDPRSKKFDRGFTSRNKTRNPIRLTFDHGSTPGKRPHCFD